MSAVTDEARFFIFLIERYAAHTGRSAGDILREWDERGITQKIYDNYELYHQERIENAYEDIASLMATGEHAW